MYSPGLLMLIHLIEHAQKTGVSEFDFSAGAEDFRHRFANAAVPIGRGFVSVSPLASTARHARAVARKIIVGSLFDQPLLRAAVRRLRV